MPYPNSTMWADPNDDAFNDYDPNEVVLAITYATWLAWALAGRKIHAAGYRTELYELPPQSNGIIRLMSPVDELLHVDALADINDSGNEITGSVTLVGARLQAYPPQNLAPYDPMNGSRCRKLVRVEYTVKSNLPPGTEGIVKYLAEQYLLALTGGKCALPERVQSISRQGVSWTILDPQTFLDAGRTGMIKVDAWLVAVNPSKAKSKARVLHPAEGVLVEAEWEDEAS